MSKRQVRGAKELKRNLDRVGINAHRQINDAVQATAVAVQRNAVRSIQAPGSGAVYDSVFATINGRAVPVGPRSGNNLSATHQASAPGEAPASDTGTLANSVRIVPASNLNATVFTNIRYGMYLELGTRNMAERPWLRPAMIAAAPELERRLSDLANKAAQGIG